MPKMFLVLMILLLANNICNAAIYKNIENDFLIDIGDFGVVNEVYGKYFSGECPARCAMQAAALPKGALVEIEAIAVKK